MKEVLICILTVCFMFQSCRYKTQDQVAQKPAPIIEEAVVHVDTIKKTSAKVCSFIGKKTCDIEVSKMHACLGLMLPGKSSKTEYAIAQYSTMINQCHQGKSKFVIERLLPYQENGKAIFLIVDELDVMTNYPTISYGSFRLTLENDTESNYFIEFYNNNSEVITEIGRIWRIDLEKEKFVEISKPKNLRLANPDYIETDEDQSI